MSKLIIEGTQLRVARLMKKNNSKKAQTLIKFSNLHLKFIEISVDKSSQHT
jgi:hypothetical protein